MPPIRAPGSEPHRIIATDELRRFEICPLAWWYDRHHPLARASEAELARRMALLEAVYGPGSRDLPEYRLLAHLRDQSVPASLEQPRSTSSAAPQDTQHPLLTLLIVLGLAIVALIAGGMFYAMSHP